MPRVRRLNAPVLPGVLGRHCLRRASVCGGGRKQEGFDCRVIQCRIDRRFEDRDLVATHRACVVQDFSAPAALRGSDLLDWLKSKKPVMTSTIAE